MSVTTTDLSRRAQEAKAQLDAHVREIVEWHFNPETGCSFWLDFAAKLDWEPRREIASFEDLRRFPPFEDEGEREQPCDEYPWDGVSGVRPFRTLAAQTTVGVY